MKYDRTSNSIIRNMIYLHVESNQTHYQIYYGTGGQIPYLMHKYGIFRLEQRICKMKRLKSAVSEVCRCSILTIVNTKLLHT